MFNFCLNTTRPFHLLSLFFIILVGLIISSPVSAKRSPEEAFHYQKHMAQAGYSSAIYKLAAMYQNGYGTPHNFVKALELYEESFKLGYKPAESRISEIKLMIKSGDFDKPVAKTKALKGKAKVDEAENLKAERAKLQQERTALERSKQKTARAQAEQRKLVNELRILRAEKKRFEEEKQKEKQRQKEIRRMNAKKQLEKWRLESSAMEEFE